MRVVLVEAHARGLGVGSALIAAAERALRDSGFLTATLWVLPDNAQAVRCYERCGWRAGGSKRITDFGGREIRWMTARSVSGCAGARTSSGCGPLRPTAPSAC